MSSYAMVIDLDKCSGCYNCFLACRDEHYGNDFPPVTAAQPFEGHFWMQMVEVERGKYPKVKLAFIPKPCMQCDDSPCVKQATNGAVYKRPDGIVIIDPEKSVGQKEMLSSCPHRVIFWNQEKNIPQKCTFCAHLLDQGWKEPRCVEACPTGALVFGDLSDPESEISRLWNSGKAETFHPEFELEPRVKYIGIPKRFIAGAVFFKDHEECVENAKVRLSGKGRGQIAKTNNFGDFEFEGLGAGENFKVKIEYPGYIPQTFDVQTKADVYLGDILLKKEPKKKPEKAVPSSKKLLRPRSR
jgi:Fe-S-cluster-containing dehydrogenase component